MKPITTETPELVTTIEEAVAVLNKAKWRDRDDWQPPNPHHKFIEVAKTLDIPFSHCFLWNEDAIAIANSIVLTAALRAKDQRIRELEEALKDLACQCGYWSDSIGGITTGGLSELETAFDLLGWDDPHPMPDACCDEPGCRKRSTCGTPTSAGYRQTCYDHQPNKVTSSQSPR